MGRGVAEPHDLMEGGTSCGQDQPAAESRRLLEGHGSALHVYCRVPDLADAVHDPAERAGEPPGVESAARVVEVLDVPRGDARRRGTSRNGEGDPILDQDPAPGDEDLRDVEPELGMAPSEGHPVAVRHDGGEDLPALAVLRQIDPRVTCRRNARQQHNGKEGSRESAEDQEPAAHRAASPPENRKGPYFRMPFSLKNFCAPGWRYFSASGVTCPTAFCGVSAAAPFQTAASSALLSKIAFRI